MSTLPLVLLPGTLCDDRLWESLRTRLPAGTEIICPIYTQGDSMSEVVAYLKTELPERFALAGFSLGGLAALELLRQFPDAVDRLALISSHAFADSTDSTQVRLQQLEQARTQGVDALIRDLFIPAGLMPSHPAYLQNAHLLQAMAARFDLADVERQTLMATTRADQHQCLASFTRPTLILASHNDKLCTPDKPLAASQAQPNARLVWIEGSGHYLPLEQPEWVAEELNNWLEAKRWPHY